MNEPPPEVAAEITALAAAATVVIPAKSDDNLLIGSWNLRAFSEVTPKWAAEVGDSPTRDWRAVALIAEIISHFDVVAVQEIRRNPAALRHLLGQLGPTWRVIVSDVTEGDAGNGERLGFVYDSDRVQPSGLVGEIVLASTAPDIREQFARSPYAVSFSRKDIGFLLTTDHILWGDNEAARLPEITAFAQWMRNWLERTNDWNENLLVLGDFNLDRFGSPLYEAFVNTGLFPPTDLSDVPRTIFDDDKTRHFYDQIAWFYDAKPEKIWLSHLDYVRGGSFDFLPHVFAGLTKNQISWRMSDHYPLWVEFRIEDNPD